MKTEILEKSKEYDAEVFAIKKEDGGEFSRKITIYGNEKVEEVLKEDWDIEEGIMSSFFSGKTEFEFQSFNDATEKELSNCWYIGKTHQELHTMLYPKMVRYSGSFRNDPIAGISEQIIAGVWLLLIMAILLLSYYDLVYSKKEQMIRIVLGADSKNMIFHKFIGDTVGFLIAVIAAILVLLPFTNPLFRWKISIKGLEPYSNMVLEWDKLLEKEGNYILIPEGSNKSEIFEEIMRDGNLYGLSDDNLLGVITYKKGISVIAEGILEEQMDYSFKIKNPIIFLDTYDYGALPVYPVSDKLRDDDQPEGVIAERFAYLMQFTTLDNNQEKLYKFADETSGEAINPNLVEFTTISVGDWFEGLWSLQNRSLLIALILTVLIIILELQISSLTLRMTYEAKAQELTIKKVMGYSIFERFRPFFLMLIILCGLSLIGAILFSKIFKIGILSYIILGSIVVFIMDISVLIYWIKKHDNMQIQKVLKGGI